MGLVIISLLSLICEAVPVFIAMILFASGGIYLIYKHNEKKDE